MYLAYGVLEYILALFLGKQQYKEREICSLSNIRHMLLFTSLLLYSTSLLPPLPLPIIPYDLDISAIPGPAE
jgi:hypothetical protein